MVEIILGIGSFEISLDKAITFDDISGAISIDKIGGLAEALSEKADKSEIPTVDVDKEYVDEQNALQDIELNAVKSDVDDHEERIEALENRPIEESVSDVQINGTSIVVDKVANIPIASYSQLGLVKTDNSSGGFTTGLFQLSDGQLYVNTATNDDIEKRRLRKEIDANNLDYAVKQAMCDGKGAEWTEAEKANARARMGVNQAYLVEEFTLTGDTDAIERSTEPDGTPYNFESLVVVIDCAGLTVVDFSAWLRINNTKYGQWMYSGSGSMNNTIKYGVFKWIKTINGFVDSGFDCATSNGPVATQSLSTMSKVTSNIVRLNTIINDFRLYTLGGKVIPAGTKISIYGVRA